VVWELYGSESLDLILLGYDAMQSFRVSLMFQRNFSFPFIEVTSTLRTGSVSIFKIFVTTCENSSIIT
jgi:hypothetical protein